MAIIKDIQLPNGVTGLYHKIVKIETINYGTGLQAQVGSWPTYESYESGIPAIWNHYIEIPILDLYSRTQQYLLLTEPFTGSTIMPEVSDLEKEKLKKWFEIKLERNRREFGGFTWGGSIFDSDSTAQSRIQGGVQLATIAQASNQPFTINWTLQDNSVIALNGTQMIQVGMALAQHVQTLHETARVLRAQVDAATTVEQIEAINWPNT